MSSVGLSHAAARSSGANRRALLYRALSFGITFAVPTMSEGQVGGINQGGPGYLHGQADSNMLAQPKPSEEAVKLEQMRQAERQRRLTVDVAKLVESSNQLKAAIDQGLKDQLSLDALRRAGDIEKLAQDVKKWLRY